MPVDFEYKLDRSSKKFECPNCGKKTLVRYVNINGEFLQGDFGRCDREINCGFLSIPNQEKVIVAPSAIVHKQIQFIDFNDAVATSCHLEDNTLIRFLISKIGFDATNEVIQNYRIGVDQTNPNTRDWIIWWQFDINGNCRSGKLMKYRSDGHRDKTHPSTWYHKVDPKYRSFEVTQCFFGEHLIQSFPNRKIAIVESEKTACIASHFIPDYTWLASGSLTGLGYEKCKVLKNRNVTLFPDLGAYDKWKEKANEYKFNISNALEQNCTDDQRSMGLDLADFLIK